jgi:hypothetical protein
MYPPVPSNSPSNSDSSSNNYYWYGSRLVHVTALIRHGAQTPYVGPPKYRCWDGYWESTSTGVWDCNLRMKTAPPAASANIKEEEEEEEEGEPDFLFQKRYNALLSGRGLGGGGGKGNALNSTCQLGQLLMRGYDQELRKGVILKAGYFYKGGGSTDDGKHDI